MNEFMKSIGTCLWHVPMGRHRRLPKGTCPRNLAIDKQSLSGIRSLVWSAPWATTFLQGVAHWHMARATWHQSRRHWHHRLSTVPARRMVPRRSRSAQPFVLQVPKCLNRHTHRQKPLSQLFFSDPPEEILEHKDSNAYALEPLYSMILNYYYKDENDSISTLRTPSLIALSAE